MDGFVSGLRGSQAKRREEVARHLDVPDTELIDPQASASGTNLLQIAWNRKALIVLGAVLGAVIGALYYVQRSPVYMSATQILVVKKNPDMPIIDENRVYNYEDYLAVHLVLLRSPLIVGRASKNKKYDLQALETFAGKGDPTGTIIGSLGISRDGTKDSMGGFTNILNLNYRGPVAEDCPKVLECVLESYKDFLDETYRSGSEDKFLQIKKLKEQILGNVEEREQKLRDFKLRSTLVFRGKEGINIHQTRLFEIETKRSVLLDREADLAFRIEKLEIAIKNGPKGLGDLAALMSDPSWTKGKGILDSDSDDKLLPLMLEEQQLLEDFGPDHPKVASLRKKMQFTRNHYSNQLAMRTQLEGETSSDPYENYLRALKREQAAVKLTLESLNERLKNEATATRNMFKEELEEEELRNHADYARQLYAASLKALDQMTLSRDLGGFDAKVISPAGYGWQIEPRPFPIFSVALFLGLMGGLGLAYLAEITDKSFRTPEEIRRRLGLPVVGHIPMLRQDIPETTANGSAIHPALCTYHRPKSTEAEAYRGVRTSLYFSTRGGGHKVIQVTSPNKADGKSTLAANLAVSIAQSGKKIVLLDADFRKPRQHKIFGISPATGLASVVNGDAEVPETIQDSGVPNLSLIPCGPIPPNPAELLTSPRFKEVLDVIKEQFEFVLIDTPPLLAVTDPCVVAARVDGVLLVVKVSKNGRPHAERAKEILSNLGANVLGVVVNGVGTQGRYTSYGYGNYRYGYGGYGYGYGYGYGNEGYYAEDPNALVVKQPAATEAATRVDGEQEVSPPKSDGFFRRMFKKDG